MTWGLVDCSWVLGATAATNYQSLTTNARLILPETE